MSLEDRHGPETTYGSNVFTYSVTWKLWTDFRCDTEVVFHFFIDVRVLLKSTTPPDTPFN